MNDEERYQLEGRLARNKDQLREEMELALEFLSQKGRPPTVSEWGVFRTESKLICKY